MDSHQEWKPAQEAGPDLPGELEALRRENAALKVRLEDFLGHIPALVYLKDRQGRYEFANRAWEDILGIPPEEVLGRTPHDIFDQEQADTFAAEDEIVLSCEGPVTVEQRVRLKDGPGVLLTREVALRDASGQAYAIYGVSADVTELKEAERRSQETSQRLQALMDALPVGVSFTTDATCHKVVGNLELYRQFEALPPENLSVSAPDAECPGRRIRFLRDGRPVQGSELPLQRAIAEERTIEPMELEVELPSGRRWVVQASASPVRDFQGRVLGSVGVNVDVSGRKRDEERLREAMRRVEDASRAKSEFLANMSHEIRTPLNGIAGMLQLLARKNADPALLRYIQVALKSCTRLAGLLADILDLSRAEAGILSAQEAEFSPAELLDRIAELFEPAVRDKGLALHISLDRDLPGRLVGDQARLRQILCNLVGNAVKYTRQGSVRVRAEGASGPQGDRLPVRFLVSDTGIGIPEEQQTRIFEPFVQAENSHSRPFQGAGLGLALVQRLAAILGGEVSLSSVPGQGTTVALVLPLFLAGARGRAGVPSGVPA
jgi:PAS domain S-box-containing protein